MSEEMQNASSDIADPAAMSLALAGASREESDAFLRDQRQHLHEQLKQIHLDIFEKWLGVALRLATLCVGIGAATGVCLMVWDAAHSNGLLIEPFSVPPDMAAKGLNGQVIASQVQDRLTEMQARSLSFRPARSYANNWGNDIKVEIPETGVSIGEFRRFLRDWLGHDIHIMGEVWHTDSGVAVSSRTGGERGATFTGSASELDSLVQKAAEHVFSQTQPYRYASYVRNQLRIEESRAIYQALTRNSSREEQAWAWQGLATLPGPGGSSDRDAVRNLRRAIAIYPDYILGHTSLAGSESNMGHGEIALAETRLASNLLSRSSIPDIDAPFIPLQRATQASRQSFLLGDFAGAAAAARAGLELPDQANQHDLLRRTVWHALALLHESTAARAFSSQIPPPTTPASVGRRHAARLLPEAAAGNWNAVLALAPSSIQGIEEASHHTITGPAFDRRDTIMTQVYPWLALAKAKLGDYAGAQAAIAPTPGDCFDCLRVRGMIAAEARQWAEADRWFARAVHEGPSLPFAYTDWGRSLLAYGQPDAAIAKFKLASQKGPRFADPLEFWGEALMAKNLSHRALAKFAQAEKYAPNWGRLHLKWGEALVYARKPSQAKAQFARAAALDLTPSEKSELARMLHV